MLPVSPMMATQAYLHTSGSTPQSAARRFWMNRFRTGGPRLFSSGLSYQATPGMDTDQRQFTSPGGVPGLQTPGLMPIRPFVPPVQANVGPMMGLNAQAPGLGSGNDPAMVQSSGAPRDLMGEARRAYTPGSAGLQQGAVGPVESVSDTNAAGRFNTPVGNNMLWEEWQAQRTAAWKAGGRD